MGDIAESLLDGEFDFITGEYLGRPCGYPRSVRERSTIAEYSRRSQKVRSIRKELALLIKAKFKEGDKQAVCNARCEINKKYGKGWRQN